MEKCPQCGHWTLSYDSAREEWVCYCQHTINTNTGEHPCQCTCTITETRESYHRRLHAQNLLNHYGVDSPSINDKSRFER